MSITELIRTALGRENSQAREQSVRQMARVQARAVLDTHRSVLGSLSTDERRAISAESGCDTVGLPDSPASED